MNLKMLALADPMRRAIINRLQQGETYVMELAATFGDKSACGIKAPENFGRADEVEN